MVVQFSKFTNAQRITVGLIARRALDLGIYADAQDCRMDISATNVTCPLDLRKLLTADDFNFWHDMGGIQRHLNRHTGELEHCFDPRCSLPEVAA